MPISLSLGHGDLNGLEPLFCLGPVASLENVALLIFGEDFEGLGKGFPRLLPFAERLDRPDFTQVDGRRHHFVGERLDGIVGVVAAGQSCRGEGEVLGLPSTKEFPLSFLLLQLTFQ